MSIDVGYWFRLFLLFGPALGLSMLGLMLALRSGDARLGTELGARSMAANASQVALRLSLWVVGLAAIGEIVGLRTIIPSH